MVREDWQLAKELKLRAVQKWPKRIGKADYIRFLSGGVLTPERAIKSFCFECQGPDPGLCELEYCSLWPFHIKHRAKECSGMAPESSSSE